MNNQFWDEVFGTRGIRIAAVAALSLLAVFLLVETIANAQNLGRLMTPPVATINVNGTGKSTAVPTIATITFTVMESAPTVEAAQTAATAKANAAIAALGKEGIEDKDIQASSYNVSPQYSYPRPCPVGSACPDYIVNGTQKVTGYEVNETITVKVRDTNKAGAVLQDLGTLGVQNIYGPEFTVDDDESVKDEARTKAIADARARAETLAKELGVHLGAVVNYSENGNYPYPMMAYGKGGGVMAEDAATPPQLPVGQNETTVNVSITYEIR